MRLTQSSPVLSNIYLNYVFDLWFEKRIKPRSRGDAYLFRFADDFLGAFRYKEDAEQFEMLQKERLEGFGLEIATEKTRRLEFGAYAIENAKRKGDKRLTFTFLGFTQYCGSTRHKHFKVKRCTSMKKFRAKLDDYTEWISKVRSYLPKRELMRSAKRRIQGHLNYYAIMDNSKMCILYHYWFTRITYKWLNRCCQRKSYDWNVFNQMLEKIKWPKVRIKVDLNPFSA